jgi:hypothetical protein
MRNNRKCSFRAAVFAAAIIILGSIRTSAYLGAQEAEQDKSSPWLKKWKDALVKEPLPDGAKRLRLVRYFPEEDKAKEGVYLAGNTSICIDELNNIYVADSKENRILKFDINGKYISHIGRAGQGPGELRNPKRLFSDGKNTIYVENNGNGRIEIFSSAGEYINSLKIYKYYSGYVTDSGGRIYANYMNGKLEEENLIEVLNKDGSLDKAYGRRNKFKYDSSVHNEVILSLENNIFIYALWKHFNILKKYSLDGKLLFEKSIKNKIFNNISEENDSMMKPADHSVTARVLFTGFYVKAGKLFIMKQYPRLEIYECKENGDIDHVYWADTTYNYIGEGLAVVNDDKNMYFVTVQSFPEKRIEVYSVIK